MTVGGVNFPRRGTIDVSDTFRIRPLHSEARLRQMATAAKPPAESGDLRVPDLVDLKAVDKPEDGDHFLSPPVRAAITATLQKGEQTIVFLNRRGFSAFV